jgi:hypothetical protein
LVDLIVREAAIELAFENTAGVIGAEFRQSTDMNDKLSSGTKAGFHFLHVAAFQEFAEARLGGFDGGLVEFAALEKIDVLACDRRQFLAQHVPPIHVPAQQECRSEQNGEEHRQDCQQGDHDR